MKKVISILCLVALMVSLCACGSTSVSTPTSQTPSGEQTAKDPVVVTMEPMKDLYEKDTERDEFATITMAEDYSDVEAAIEKLMAEQRNNSRGWYSSSSASGAIAVDEEFEMADSASYSNDYAKSEAPMEAGMGGGGDTDYSETNAQVEGIDEADVVKTDGKYIYILRGYYLIIATAEGKDSKVLSQTQIGYSRYEDYNSKTKGKSNYRYISENKNANDLYIYKDTVVVMANTSYYESRNEGLKYFSQDYDYVSADIYNVADRSNPELVVSLGQDGYMCSSRLKDNKLYVVSNKYNYSYWYDEEYEIEIPKVYVNGDAEKIAATDICIAPIVESESYAIVCEYDLDKCERTSEVAILGGGSDVYMSHNNIYVMDSTYYDNESEPRTEKVYTVIDHTYETLTSIFRFSIENGLNLEAIGKVPGMLDSQYSVDEYNDTFRLVTTYDAYSYTTYEDEEMGFMNYKYPEEDIASQSGLYVLDMDLNTIGSVEGLAEDEYIYSARFDGDIAYFCTFRQVDPLFTVDLTDPTNPEVQSELKISGFSDYLHPWTSTLLFGAGYEADEDTGWREDMKLVMFDTTNKADVTVANYLNTDISGSSALYNPKAFLIDYNKNIIGFPGYRDYYIFTYDNESGFTMVGEISMEGWSWDSRGLYVNDIIYIVGSENMYLIDMGTFERIAVIDFMKGLDPYSQG